MLKNVTLCIFSESTGELSVHNIVIQTSYFPLKISFDFFSSVSFNKRDYLYMILDFLNVIFFYDVTIYEKIKLI